MKEVAKYAPWIEKIGVLILIIGLSAELINISTEFLIAIGLLTLAIAFFIASFGYNHEEDKQLSTKEMLGLIITPRILWISCSVSVNGILFYYLALEGYKEILQAGTLSITACLVIFAYLHFTETNRINKINPILGRALALLVVNLYILLT